MKIFPTTKYLDTEEEMYRRWQRTNHSKKIPISHLRLLVSATAAFPVVGRNNEPDCFSKFIECLYINTHRSFMQQGIIITSLVLFSEPAFPGACEHSCGFGLKLLSHNSEKKNWVKWLIQLWKTLWQYLKKDIDSPFNFFLPCLLRQSFHWLPRTQFSIVNQQLLPVQCELC